MYEYIINFTNQELPCQRIRSVQKFQTGSLLEIPQTQGKVIAKVGVIMKNSSDQFQDCDGLLYLELLQYLVTHHEKIGKFYLPEKLELEQKKFFN